jgi:hypothetical protein
MKAKTETDLIRKTIYNVNKKEIDSSMKQRDYKHHEKGISQ